MQQNKTYKMTGLFVFVGMLCLGAIIFNYVGRRFTMDQKNLVVMYFEESILGLSVGSSVVFQGVEIGKVEKIRLVTNLQKGTFKTPVYVLFDKKKILQFNSNGRVPADAMLKNLIEKGLRARLIGANYLTGALMIELVMDSEQPAVMRGTGKYLEIPTELSSFAMFSNDLKEVPVRESLLRLSDLIADLNQNMPAIMSNVSQITAKMNRMLDQKSGEATKTMNNLNATLEEISKTSRSVKNLTDYLERHPEALLKGKEK